MSEHRGASLHELSTLVPDLDRRQSPCKLVLDVLHHRLHQLCLHIHELLHSDRGVWIGGNASAPTSASASSSGGHLFSKTNVQILETSNYRSLIKDKECQYENF
jgi:hypothetical protein